MELLTIKIKPLSPFATIPKGDTLFGQIVAYFFLNGDNTFENYLSEEPKLIVSDMMPLGYVYKPTLPLACFSHIDEETDKKKLRKRKFISLENLQKGALHLCEKVEYTDDIVSMKNSINRTTFTTEGDNFAPYGLQERVFTKELWVFMLVESEIKETVLSTLQDIGKYGFGKDGNVGKGNFEIEEMNQTIVNTDSSYYMSLSPTILKNDNIIGSWYEPFTRFGKFGLTRAHNNAFKKPALMADSAAVVKLKAPKQFFGTSINNGSEKKVSFLQGYSVAIPIGIKDDKCLNIK